MRLRIFDCPRLGASYSRAVVGALLDSSVLRVNGQGGNAWGGVDAHLFTETRDDAAVRRAVADADLGDVSVPVEAFDSSATNELLVEPENWR